jgi:hypothetical protein
VVYIGIYSGFETIYFKSFTENIDDGYKKWNEIRSITESNKELLTNDILRNYFCEKSDERFFGVNYNYLNMTVFDTTQMNNSSTRGIIYSSEESNPAKVRAAAAAGYEWRAPTWKLEDGSHAEW